jgi:hypothetical protein
MSCARLVLPLAAGLLVAVSGCGTARLIETTPDGGVVAIPSNSNSWPFRYRESAEKLMAQKCPNGYDIVSEREVVVGQRSTTSELTDTAPGDPSRQTTRVVTTTRPETEYRIAFHAHRALAAAAPAVLMPAVAQSAAPVLTPVSASTPGLGLPPRPIPVTP